MSDAMQVAQQRRKDYKKAIATKENEIAELNELIADLDSFIEFGEALVGNDKVKERAVVSRPVSKSQPISDPEDEWATEEPQQGMARVISQRAG